MHGDPRLINLMGVECNGEGVVHLNFPTEGDLRSSVTSKQSGCRDSHESLFTLPRVIHLCTVGSLLQFLGIIQAHQANLVLWISVLLLAIVSFAGPCQQTLMEGSYPWNAYPVAGDDNVPSPLEGNALDGFKELEPHRKKSKERDATKLDRMDFPSSHGTPKEMTCPLSADREARRRAAAEIRARLQMGQRPMPGAAYDEAVSIELRSAMADLRRGMEDMAEFAAILLKAVDQLERLIALAGHG